MKLTNIKTVILGSKVKFLYFDRPISYDYENVGARNRNKSLELDLEPKTTDSMEESARKARSRLRQIMWSNSWQHFDEKGRPYKPQFSTFTFNHDITDYETGHPIYKNFRKRLDYACSKLFPHKLFCVTVPEFQKDIDFHGRVKPNGGRVHYHSVFFNLPFINDLHSLLEKTWGHGFVLNKTIRSVEHLSNYVAKYIQKDLENKHIKFKKRYLVSRGVKRPITIYDQEFAKEYCRYISSLSSYTAKESDYENPTDGRKIHEIEMVFPDGFDLASLVNQTPQDTARFVEQFFKIEEEP